MSPIDLSIVIPAYNAAPFLEPLFTSFLAMKGDFRQCEIILVNDGSTDETALITQQWITRGLIPLKVIHTPGLGPGQARELGAAQAQADWVALVDADEQFSPGWLQAALEFVRHPAGAVACEGVVEICDRDRISLFSHQTQSLKPGRYLTANLILKRSLVHFYPRYGRKFYFREDSDLAFQLLEAGEKIAHSPALLLYHPPLPAVWWKPLRLALRYQYDALLAYRFPQRYWSTVDAHKLLGQHIPLMRLWLLFSSLLLQMTAFSLLVMPLPLLLRLGLVGSLLILSSLLSLAPILLYVPIRQIKPAQVPLALLVHQGVPVLTLSAWVYGFWRYRGEPRFTVTSTSRH